ncbi:MAG TPA: chemotaxis protein CheA [Vicinamibacterales bacterium]|nr:chemotaxis protein CheA [Vicinamibacterales bacterium]
MTDFLDSFLDDYFAEAEEHLAAIRRALLTLEHSVGHRRIEGGILEELFRSFHSLKGIAGMVDHRETEALAHELESYLRTLREGDAILTPGGMDLLIKGAGALEASIVARRNNETARDTEPIVGEIQALIARDSETQPAPVPESPGHANWLCMFTPSPGLIARGINVDLVRARLREHGEIISAMPIVTPQGSVAFRFEVSATLSDELVQEWQADGLQCSPIATADIASAPDAAIADRSGTILSSGHYVRVDLARLDELMRMIGNLVILRSRLTDTLARCERHLPPSHFREIEDDAEAIERELRELREGVMRIRLVPIGEIFRRMPFVVRDLARESGRSVNVVLNGQDTKIDKFLVERMMDPVLHLVRNAVSHGIETPAEREAAGKPLAATLRLSASASGETVLIEIADDGRGIDTARIIQRARQLGLAVPAELDNAALLEVISAPGFSTREASDRISGRGFGMNVVRETLQELGGTIELHTEHGKGTRFVIELPLTLAITAAMLARVGDQVFAVPQAAVREVAEFEGAAIRALQGAEVVEFRGAPLPVLRLSKILGIAPSDATRFHAFIVGTGPAAVALLVDRIVGHREIVVRATADPLIRVDGVTGATDLGDGKAVLILDAAAIARQARDRHTRRGLTVVRGIA